MRVKMLGTGQDGGVPHVACYCPTCNYARKHPAAARSGPSIGVYDPADGSAWMVDASPDFRLQLDAMREATVGVRPEGKFPLDGIILTHGHFGHYWGLGYLGKEACSPKELPVYCTTSMADYLRQNRPFADLLARKNIVITEVAGNTPVIMPNGLKVTPMTVPHRQDVTDTVGYVLTGPEKTLLYIPDMDDYTDAILAAVAAADIAVLDGCFYSGQELPNRNLKEIPHPFIPYSMDRLADLAGKTEIWFTHFNHSNFVLRADGQARDEVLSRGFYLAADGDTFTI